MSAPTDSPGEIAALGLGSNLGDRRGHLDRAIARLASHPGIRILRLSDIRETDPVGGPPQGKYLNAVVLIATTLEPRALLAFLQEIEAELGRVRRERFGPRTIDLDLLLYGGAVIAEPDLVVPHPRLCERAFVLEPLAQVAPELRHPVSGRTVADLWLELRSGRDVACS